MSKVARFSQTFRCGVSAKTYLMITYKKPDGSSHQIRTRHVVVSERLMNEPTSTAKKRAKARARKANK